MPKKELVASLQVLLQTRRLKVAKTLPEAATLVRELETFRVKVTEAANETFGAWREGQHDDLVLAVALAAWMGERCLPEGPVAWRTCWAGNGRVVRRHQTSRIRARSQYHPTQIAGKSPSQRATDLRANSGTLASLSMK